MKESNADSRQPSSRLDAEFDRFRIRGRHVLVIISIAVGIYVANFVRTHVHLKNPIEPQEDFNAEGEHL